MKTFLITGGTTGIGAATARMAVEAGYRVALAARSADKLTKLVAELGGSEKAIAIQCDVSRYEDQQKMVAETLQTFERIDVAFANAGIGATDAGTEKGDPENWREMVLTNVLGCALTAKVCLPEIRKNQGHIILTGSNAGRRTLRGSVYGATKWAVTGFGYNLQEEVAGDWCAGNFAGTWNGGYAVFRSTKAAGAARRRCSPCGDVCQCRSRRMLTFSELRIVPKAAKND